MTSRPPPSQDNALLSSLSPAQQQRVLEFATKVSVNPGKVVADAEQPIRDVYFPTTAVFSLLSVMPNRVAVECAVVGHEGMTPLAAFHQVDSTAEQVIAQVPGEAWRLSREAFHAVLADVLPLHPLLHRYSQALFTFAAQSSACNRQHTVVERCARWLLTTHDRVPGDEFCLTHLFLSQMLGVRRSSVTVAAEVLRAAGAITYTRGRVRVVDRALLHSRACTCYDIVRSTYDRPLAGRDTRSPLMDVALSDGTTSFARGGSSSETRPSPVDNIQIPEPEVSLSVFRAQLRDARQRAGALSTRGTTLAEGPHVLELIAELGKALEQLAVSEQELTAQVEALAQMRLALEAQQDLWRGRIDGLPDAFIETDHDDIITEMNRSAEDLLGKPRRIVIGSAMITLFPDTDRRGLRDVIARLREGRRALHWSGTLLGAEHYRPTVHVAVAAAPGRVVRAAAPPRPTGSYAGARWLLRPTRAWTS